jgi:hypothetical protein
MNPVNRILGLDVSKDRDIIDKKGYLVDSEQGTKKLKKIFVRQTLSMQNPLLDNKFNTERVDTFVPIWVPTEKKLKIDVEDEIFKIIDNPKLTQEQKIQKLKPYETYMRNKGWRYPQ